MPDKNWRPNQLDNLDSKWINVPENVSAQEAERLMLQFLRLREEWLEAYVNATYYEDICNWKYNSAYNVAFLKSDGSVKSKETEAESDALVRAAKLAVIEARAAVIKTKLKLESTVLAHHSMKKIFEEASSERRYL